MPQTAGVAALCIALVTKDNQAFQDAMFAVPLGTYAPLASSPPPFSFSGRNRAIVCVHCLDGLVGGGEIE